jgi:hypothetical protein
MAASVLVLARSLVVMSATTARLAGRASGGMADAPALGAGVA